MSDYTDKNFTSGDWALIQDCIVDAISLSNSLEETKRLEQMLERVGRKYAQTRVN